MDVVIMLVFISLVLVAGAILFFLIMVKGGDFEHGDRLSLLPLEPDGDGEERKGNRKGTDAIARVDEREESIGT